MGDSCKHKFWFCFAVSETLQRVAVATIAPLESRSQYDITFNEGENPGSIWPNGIPSDGTPIEVEHFPYPVVMGIVYTYSCLGVLFALSCFTFNLVFRKRKSVLSFSLWFPSFSWSLYIYKGDN